jgi:hypothetical protein
MMITINIATVFAIIAGLMSVACAAGLYVILRSTHALRSRCTTLETSLATLQRDLESMTADHAAMGRRLQRIESEHSGVADRVDLVESRGTSQSFDLAIDSARRGADPKQLTKQFGLSRGEAELVSRMHGMRKNPNLKH